MRDVPNLDFLRSMAVVSVVLEHTLLALNIKHLGNFEVGYFGVLGVMVFFVLTSMVLMWSLDRRPYTLDFYVRRFFRIYPLAWAALLLVLLFHAPTGVGRESFFGYGWTTWKHFGVQASLLVPTGPLLLGPMWSLPYEVEMYLLLPMLYFFVRRNFAVWPLLLLWALVLENAKIVPNNTHNFAVAIAYFLPGVMAYVGTERWKPRLPGWLLPPCLAAGWMGGWYHANFHRCWYFCLAIGLAIPLFHQMKSRWIVVPSQVIARYSYGIYLMHPFALVIGLYLLRSHGWLVQLLGVVVPLVVLPVLAYHALEHPMIRLGSRVASVLETQYEQLQSKFPRASRVEEGLR